MKKLKKTLKITALSLACIISLGIVAAMGFYFVTTKSIALNSEKLEASKLASSFKIVDINGTPIKPSTENYISIKKLSSNTKNAFISAEDKRFYTHNGLDYIRIGGALVSNIKSRSFSQGASTISQQLIKNTHLSSEKTIARKLKEIKLTKELESQYSKDQILEFYLNNIYFGNGAYGIENASIHYFGKSASNLTLAEAALLAGTINAPSFYDIENKQDNAIKRRNLILDLMQKYGKISAEELATAKNEPITLNITKVSNNNYLFDEAIKEASKITNLTETMLKNSNLKIYTEVDLSLTKFIESTIKNNYSKVEGNPKIACFIIDNKTSQIVAMAGSKQLLSSNISPGSATKPLLVFAPAIENNLISPATKILDEPINISGYAPSNADGKFHGYVSVREALSKSYNIPAVKILQELGVNNAIEFAKKVGINLTDSDNNLSIALGSITDGISLKSLADAYSSFANSGEFLGSSIISKITQNGKTIYQKRSNKNRAMTDSTAYLITDMLLSTSSAGTAKRLKTLPFQIASKTGTVGMSNSTKNLYAINVSYTTNHTAICCFSGNNLPESVNGGTYPTMLAKDIFEHLYKTQKPQNFSIPSSVKTKSISKENYKNNIISTTDNPTDSITEIFSKTNLPSQDTSTLDLKLEVFNFKNKKPILCLFTSPNYTYKFIRKEKDKEVILVNLDNVENANFTKFEDKTAKNNEIYEYFAEICEKSTNKIFLTNAIKLKTFS